MSQLQNVYKEASLYTNFQDRWLSIPKEVQDMMMSTPLWIAMTSKIERIESLLSKYWINNQFVIDDVFQDLDDLRCEDIDSLTKMFRNKPAYIDVESKLWTRPFHWLYNQHPCNKDGCNFMGGSLDLYLNNITNTQEWEIFMKPRFLNSYKPKFWYYYKFEDVVNPKMTDNKINSESNLFIDCRISDWSKVDHERALSIARYIQSAKDKGSLILVIDDYV
jgi:hypothetical protein